MNDELIENKCELFINDISTKYIKFKEKTICYFNDRIYIKLEVEIERFNLIFNYGMDLPIVKDMFNKKFNFDLSQRIKYDIYQYIVNFIELDKLGNMWEV